MQLSRLSDISRCEVGRCFGTGDFGTLALREMTRCNLVAHPLPLVTGGMEPRGVALRGVSYDSFCFHVQHPVMKQKDPGCHCRI